MRDKNLTVLNQRNRVGVFLCLDTNSNVEGHEKNSVTLSLLPGDYMYMLEIMTVIMNN